MILNGSGSTSSSGNPLTYSWTLTSRPAGSTTALTGATAVSPTFVADKSGTYVAQLIVNDDFQSSAPSTATISATLPPAPVPNAGPDQTVTEGSTVVLNGSGSTSGSSNTLTYSWTRPKSTELDADWFRCLNHWHEYRQRGLRYVDAGADRRAQHNRHVEPLRSPVSGADAGCGL